MKQLHDYQKIAIDWILEKPKCALFLTMGAGKTITTIKAIEQIKPQRVLIIAPLRVAQSVWAEEAQAWDSPLTFSKVIGAAAKREKALSQNKDVYVVNVENTEWLAGKVPANHFDMIVVDELSCFKSSTSKRFKALRKLTPARFVGLTGTPAPNGLEDLWSQLYLIDAGQRLLRSKTAYLETYFKPDKRNGHIVYSWKLRNGCDQQIYDKIADVCMSMPSTAKLPDRVDIEHNVLLDKDTQNKIKTLKDDMVVDTIEAGTAAVLCSKLQQMASGAVYDSTGLPLTVHDHKLKALCEIVSELQHQPCLVFYWFKHEAQRIMRALPQAKLLQTAQDIEDFNNGKIEVLLLNPASAGHGINLQRGGSQCVWYTLPWSLELYNQACARLHRQGQQNTVYIHHLIASGTIDKSVFKALQDKDVTQNRLIAAVRLEVHQ